MNPIPSIPKDLVEFLDSDQMHSAKASMPRVGETDREVWIKVGKHQLVQYLAQLLKDQETGADQGFPHVFIRPVDGSAASDDHAGSAGDPGPRASAPGSYPSPADRLGRFPQ